MKGLRVLVCVSVRDLSRNAHTLGDSWLVFYKELVRVSMTRCECTSKSWMDRKDELSGGARCTKSNSLITPGIHEETGYKELVGGAEYGAYE